MLKGRNMPRQDPTNTENSDLLDRVVTILERARANVVRTVNSQMVIAYWLIGREIVEEEQQGKERAEYGKQLIRELAAKLTERYGKEFSKRNLEFIRRFYLTYSDRKTQIAHTVCTQLRVPNDQKSHRSCSQSNKAASEKSYTAGSESANDNNSTQNGFMASLSWSHYRVLMRIEDERARSFYEIEAAKNQWTKRQLERQINSLLFERLAKSRDKDGVMQLANEGETVQNPVEMMKDPMVKYVLDEENQRIFTSRYQLYLPSTEKLRRELTRELDICEAYADYHVKTAVTQ